MRRTLYLSLVKSHQLSYPTQVWSPKQYSLKAKIERVQRRATRWILQTRVDEMSYKERLVILNLLPLVLDRQLRIYFTTNASLVLLTLMFLNIHRLFLTAVPDKVILSILKVIFAEPVLVRFPVLIVLLS